MTPERARFAHMHVVQYSLVAIPVGRAVNAAPARTSIRLVQKSVVGTSVVVIFATLVATQENRVHRHASNNVLTIVNMGHAKIAALTFATLVSSSRLSHATMKLHRISSVAYQVSAFRAHSHVTKVSTLCLLRCQLRTNR